VLLLLVLLLLLLLLLLPLFLVLLRMRAFDPARTVCLARRHLIKFPGVCAA
jgi:hypothetical protein